VRRCRTCSPRLSASEPGTLHGSRSAGVVGAAYAVRLRPRPGGRFAGPPGSKIPVAPGQS
jgi:hypothetical protein